ncbi:MAG TPA: hypothetical protein DCK76_09590 [Desulfotomaculum sp.]|nr:MAG: Uncharacterized protein XD78_0588 [Desulfotomaculum sp. 46_296]HAG11613.1 hypothetical protein [Desulfotomaculum sp.]HBY04773.1 hypothetical protein [Desulfotomaculum sp.]
MSRIKRSKVNLLLDIVLLLIFLVTYEQKATGNVIHEWLGAAIVVILVTHMLLHWQWVVSTTKRFFQKIGAEPRINYILDAAIFICFTTILFSGLMMSRILLPSIGLKGSVDPFWKVLHSTSTDIILLLAAIHIGLHWNWIVNNFKRLLTPGEGHYDYEVNTSALKSLGRDILSIGGRTLIIITVSGILALGWYSFSTSPKAASFASYKTEIGHQHGRNDIILENFQEGRTQDRSHQMQEGRHKQGFSLTNAAAGMVKNLAVISVITVMIVFLRKMIRAKS